MSHRSNTKVIDLRALPFCRPGNKIYYNILCRLIKNPITNDSHLLDTTLIARTGKNLHITQISCSTVPPDFPDSQK